MKTAIPWNQSLMAFSSAITWLLPPLLDFWISVCYGRHITCLLDTWKHTKMNRISYARLNSWNKRTLKDSGRNPTEVFHSKTGWVFQSAAVPFHLQNHGPKLLHLRICSPTVLISHCIQLKEEERNCEHFKSNTHNCQIPFSLIFYWHKLITWPHMNAGAAGKCSSSLSCCFQAQHYCHGQGRQLFSSYKLQERKWIATEKLS